MHSGVDGSANNLFARCLNSAESPALPEKHESQEAGGSSVISPERTLKLDKDPQKMGWALGKLRYTYEQGALDFLQPKKWVSSMAFGFSSSNTFTVGDPKLGMASKCQPIAGPHSHACEFCQPRALTKRPTAMFAKLKLTATRSNICRQRVSLSRGQAATIHGILYFLDTACHVQHRGLDLSTRHVGEITAV